MGTRRPHAQSLAGTATNAFGVGRGEGKRSGPSGARGANVPGLGARPQRTPVPGCWAEAGGSRSAFASCLGHGSLGSPLPLLFLKSALRPPPPASLFLAGE